MVRFAPCARTAWHTHAMGQTLYVTEGIGLVQSRGGEVVVMRPGDTVHTPPGEWHWHGAAPEHFMTHLALWEGPSMTSPRPCGASTLRTRNTPERRSDELCGVAGPPCECD